MKKNLRIAGNVIFAVIMGFALIAGVFAIKSKMDGGIPDIAGHKLYIIMSGSMEPVLGTGSIVGVKPVKPDQILQGDIITFQDPQDNSHTITHRVVGIKMENGVLSFETRGDANNAADPKWAPAGGVIGKVGFHLPYVGYLMEFAKSKNGIVVFVILPGLVLLVTELTRLYKMLIKLSTGEVKAAPENKKLKT